MTLDPTRIHPRRARWTRGLLITVVTLAAATVAGIGQTPTTREALPSAEKVIEDYINAIGGRAAKEKFKNRRILGLMSIPAGAGRTARQPFMKCEAPPGKKYFRMGDTDSGTTGDVAWEISPRAPGPRILKGVERASVLRWSTFNFELHWKELYPSLKCDGVEDLEGKKAYRIVMTPKEGRPEIRYFDAETKLLVGERLLHTTAKGEIPIAIGYDQYKEVDGILYPHQIAQRYPGGLQVFEIESIEHDAELPKERFELPDVIRVLLERDKKKSTSSSKG